MNQRSSILLVCMGNICRSPTAHGVLRHRAVASGQIEHLRLDSAGTHGFHVGAPPDRRSMAAAARRGYDFSDLRARRISADDLHRFDYVLAMDRDNLRALEAMMNRTGGSAHVGMFMDFAPTDTGAEVPDPYYGDRNGFERVLDLVEQGSDGLLRHLQQGGSSSSSST